MTTLAEVIKASRTVVGSRKPAAIRVSPLLVEAARKEPAEVSASMGTSLAGLGTAEAEQRLEQFGPNEVSQEKQHGWFYRLLIALRNPLVILLTILAILTFATAKEQSDYYGGMVMVLMVILGVVLRFVQESRADAAAAKLKAMISVTATVVRDGQALELPLKQIVPGDIVKLAAGDMIPADIRLLSSKDLFLVQSALTGESIPVEKVDARDIREGISPVELNNICFLGTSVESGSATALVVATGSQTYFGSMAGSIIGQQVETSFDRGINKFTWLMIRLMIFLVPLVFLINVLSKHDPNVSVATHGFWQWLLARDWKEAFFFSLAVAVGLTPEMLPMIVSVCLSKGALAMSRKKVIVKRLNSIQNFGAMDVLCTDKTGTLTLDHVILERHCDVVREENDAVLEDAYLISHFQTGLRNVLDRAILDHGEVRETLALESHKKIDEIPFDFQRRIMSVAVEGPEGRRLLTKGAPEEIFRRCTRFRLDGEVLPMEQLLIDDLKDEYQSLSSDGFRVLAVAYKDLEMRAAYTKEDEQDLVLTGYVAFLDPPKETARPAIEALQKHGVTVKVLTGDNDLVTKKVCGQVGLPADKILIGTQVETMNDIELAEAAEKLSVFARLSPAHKQRIIKALQDKGHVVGYMGDGINDAPALRASDVGISVDSAVDIAKESADVILLEKSLMVLEEGVLEGRKVFANILKYVRMGASSNFGNMFSVLGASAMLNFLPMTAIQLLTNNLLYDFSQVPIPTDEVDEEQITKPRPWRIDEIKRFIFCIGPISSIFDYTTFFIMLYVFHCWMGNSDKDYHARLFQTGWFVESLMTQTLIIHVIRTNKIPFLQSRASWPLMATSVLIMVIGMYLPFSPLAKALGFEPLPQLYFGLLALTLLCYVILTQVIKTWLIRKAWI